MPVDLRKGVNLNKKPVDITNIDLSALLDMSYSMTGGYRDSTGKHSGTRWSAGIAEVGSLISLMGNYDDDGIDLIFFDDRIEAEEGVSPKNVAAIVKKYSPRGSTVLAAPLQRQIDKYLPAKVLKPASSGGLFGKAKPAVYEKMSPRKQVCFVIYTDGSPSDKAQVAKVIVDATHRIQKDSDLGILFIQVGNDSGAKDFLDRLNNDLQSEGAAFDCVACVNLEDILYSKFTPEECIKLAFNG